MYQQRNGRQIGGLRAQNPAFREGLFQRAQMDAGIDTTPMTAAGAVQKTAILLAVLIVTAVVGWNTMVMPLAIAGVFVAIALGFVMAFSPRKAPTLSVIYAVAQGYALGVISNAINMSIVQSVAESGKNAWARGAVPIAVFGTFSVLAVMLGLYRARVIRVTETFKAVILGATCAIALLYLVTLVSGLFGVGLSSLPIYGSGTVGLVFSVAVIALAAFNFVLDFHWIEEGEASGAPKFMEWYLGWGLLVTIVWLYMEILRLIAKLSRR